jgi:Protein of unknown function (DUF3237)
MSKIEVGELLYEYTLNITGMVEFGVSFGELMAGKVAPPPEGARFDVIFEGEATGQKLKGKVKGVDYIWMRGDGRVELDIHAEIATNDGQKIALYADGVGLPRKNSSIADLRENVKLFSSSKDYTWINTLQVWGIGTVDFAKQIVQITAYSA